jgi:adenosylhomocysteine nucleosidase
MTRFDPKTTLLVVALEAELPAKMIAGWHVVYTGVGKINAAASLCAALMNNTPMRVVNFGSAGCPRRGLSGIHEVTSFVQRDMDVRALGFALGQTPFEDEVIISLGRAGLSCGTGDNFVSAPPEIESDLVDMEAYALAKICQQRKIEFYCFKFVSDKADGDAASDWSKELATGAHMFVDTILNGAGGETRTPTA